MNRITIIGNICKDLSNRVTQSGHNVSSFTVAVNRRRKEGQEPEADFFRVTVWDKLAELCQKSLSKGKKVAVIGSVSVSTYKAQDGTTRASLDVMANEIEFLSPKEQQAEQKHDTQNGFVAVDNDDLPF